MFEESVPSIWASMNSWFTPTVLFVVLNLMIGTIAITSSLGTHKPREQHQEDDDDHHQPRQLARSPSVMQRLKSINFYAYRSQEPANKSPDMETHYVFGQTHHEQETPQISRSPSVLQRLKSINLYSYLSQESSTTSVLSQNRESETHFDFQQTLDREQEEVVDEEQIEEERDQFEEEEEEEQMLDEIYHQLHGGHVARSNSDTKPIGGEMLPKLPRKMRKSASAKSAFAHFEEEDIVESRRPATVKEGKAKVTEPDEEVDAKADDFINKFKHQLKLQRMDSIVRYKEMITRGSAK
ncbi:hypothetical protein UlMin_035642 [Ulmus minor]